MSTDASYSFGAYAAGPVPLWTGIVLAVGLATLLSWAVKAELAQARRRLVLSWTRRMRVVLAVLAAMWFVQPVLTMKREQRVPGLVVVMLDSSSSMGLTVRAELPDGPGAATDRLDIIAITGLPGAEGRITAPRDLARGLDGPREAMESARASRVR